MQIYIALFRGINVGGKNKIPMKALTGILEASGYFDVSTYIQSGNILFKSSHFELENFLREVGKAIRSRYGFKPSILVLNVNELEKAINSNPFLKAENKSKGLHLYFLSHFPKQPDLESLKQAKSSSERFQLIGKTFYLYAPDGIGRSKLAARLEKLIGVEMTARNWNTVTKLLEMAKEE